MHWFLIGLRKYAVFSGRARRREYWIFHLMSFAMAMVLGCLGGLVGMILGFPFDSGAALPGGGFFLAMWLPMMAVTVRRLHDIGRSGWWIFLSIVPGLGLLIFVFTCLDSQAGSNAWGPNPKAS